MFNYIDFHIYESLPGEIAYTTPIIDSFEQTNTLFDLTLAKSIGKEGVQLSLKYSSVLYSEAEITTILDYYINILQYFADSPDLPIRTEKLLGKRELHQLLHEFNNTRADFPQDKTIIDLFEEQVEKTPDNIAVVFEERRLTYRELNEQANQVGRYLRKTYQIQADDVIALQLERSEWMIIAILGVMKAGAAYLPIAPDTPKARTDFMLSDSQAKVLLMDEVTYPITQQLETTLSIEVVEQIASRWDGPKKSGKKSNLKKITSSQNLAYIIYTSGSTGRPKGVMVTHYALNNFMSGFNEKLLYSSASSLNFGWTLSYTFDASLQLLFGALLFGRSIKVGRLGFYCLFGDAKNSCFKRNANFSKYVAKFRSCEIEKPRFKTIINWRRNAIADFTDKFLRQ